MVSITSFIAAWLSFGPSTPPLDPAALARIRAAEAARIEIIQRLAPSVVCVFSKGNRAGGGSGVIIDSQGYGLTNFHVIRPFVSERRGEAGLSDGKIYPLELLGIDPGGDVAMFKLDADKPFYPAPLGDSSRLRVGDWTLAMGNPFLLADDFQPTVTFGIISGLHRYQRGEGRALVYTDCIQVDTSINPGNSGGPLFDLRGDLIGINGRISIEERGRVNVGIGYAITINQIERFIPALRAGLVTRHATLGATTRDRALHNVIIDQILSDSCAAKSGLKLGDRLLRLDGVEIESANHLLTLLGTYPGHWPVTIAYERDGKPAEVRLRLDDLALPKGMTPPSEFARRSARRNPLRPNPRANARAVTRAWDRYQRFVGRPEALQQLTEVKFAGTRRRLDKPDEKPAELNGEETRPPADSKLPTDPAELERWIRWSLFNENPDPRAAGYRVIGGDDIAGRIAVVIIRQAPDTPEYKLSFDDDSGELLAIELPAAADGRALRYEYSDYRSAGAVRWPFKRRLYVADTLVMEEDLASVEPFAGGT